MRYEDSATFSKLKAFGLKLKALAKKYRSHILLACVSIVVSSLAILINARRNRRKIEDYERLIERLRERMKKERRGHAEARDLYSREYEFSAALKVKLMHAKMKYSDLRVQYEAAVMHGQDALMKNKVKLDGLLRSQIEFFMRSKNVNTKGVQSAKYIVNLTRKQAKALFDESSQTLGMSLYV